MAFDIGLMFRNLINSVTNSTAGKLIANPFFVGIFITLIIIIIMYMNNVTVTCKNVIYTSLCIITILIIHHTVLNNKLKAQYLNTNDVKIMNNIISNSHGGGTQIINPRSNVAEVRQSYIQSNLGDNNRVGGYKYDQHPEMITSDDLLIDNM